MKMNLRELFRGRGFSIFLILMGVALLVYVSSQYYTMWASQRALEKQWSEQEKQLAANPAAAASDNLMRLTIPKIDVNAMVVDGTSEKQLLLGPGLLEKSAKPGDNGNSVITAHRDTFFRKLYDLANGDVVTVQRGGKTFHYEVTGKKIVDPSDMSVVKPTSDARLTLITCYPTYYIGPAPERLVVNTKLVEAPKDQAKNASTAAAN